MSHGTSQNEFFISYARADKQWAEWIGFVLEDQGHRVVIQAWDFRPGSNFVVEMQNAAAGASRTIMVLSPDYLQSQFATPEWSAAFVNDPQGLERKLVPVVVRPCKPTGVLKPLVHIDLTSLDEEAAREELLSGLNTARAKPTSRPAFPGAASRAGQPAFPGEATPGPARERAEPYVPRMKGPASDLEKRRFSQDAFDKMARYFESALPALRAANANVDVDFQREGASEFTAEVFHLGKSVAFCRVWRGAMHSSDGIGYSEDRNSGGRNSYNEMLSISDERGELRLAALMGAFSFRRAPDGVDEKRLTMDQAGEYLWHRLVERLER